MVHFPACYVRLPECILIFDEGTNRNRLTYNFSNDDGTIKLQQDEDSQEFSECHRVFFWLLKENGHRFKGVWFFPNSFSCSGKVPGQVPGLLGITPGLIFFPDENVSQMSPLCEVAFFQCRHRFRTSRWHCLRIADSAQDGCFTKRVFPCAAGRL